MMGLLRAGEGFTEEPGSPRAKKEKQGHISWDGGTEVAWRREKKLYPGSSAAAYSCRKISLFCTIQPIYSGGFTGRTAFLGVTVRPSISQRNCCGVRALTSCALRGHWYWLADSLLYNSSQPSPSHTNPLMRSSRLPQNRYKVSGSHGFFPILDSTKAANRSIPDRRSV